LSSIPFLVEVVFVYILIVPYSVVIVKHFFEFFLVGFQTSELTVLFTLCALFKVSRSIKSLPLSYVFIIPYSFVLVKHFFGFSYFFEVAVRPVEVA